MGAEQSQNPQSPPIPLPDIPVIAEMQIAIVNRLSEVQRAKAEGRPVVWTSVIIPREILFAMDVPVVFQEVIGGYASIFGLSAKYCQVAEEAGLSRDVCAVHRCCVGVALSEDRDSFFDMAFAEPDLVIGHNFGCMSESRSFLNVAERYDAPTFALDVPINTWGPTIPDHAIDYVVQGLREMIAFLEEHGFKLDPERLKEEVAFTKKVNAVLAEIEVLKQAVPVPISAYDTIIATMTPIAISQGARSLGMFEDLRDELKRRVEAGKGIVDDEKLRLLWVGIPPLCDFKLLNYTEKHGAVVAKSMLEFLTGFSVDPELLDPETPLESVARALIASPANPLYRGAIEYLVDAAKAYKVDGVVSVVKRTCGLVPGMQRLTKEAIFEATGAPSVVFDLDGVDSREYDAAATQATLDSFVETLLARKDG